MQQGNSTVATCSSLSESSSANPCKKLVAECGERYIEGLHNLENLTVILGQIDGQVEKIQIMQRFIKNKFKELVRKSEALFHELDILDTGKTSAKRLRLCNECEESCSKNAANIMMI
jgi:hypothetical protein